MLDVRITGYVVPLAEQPQASLTPVIAVSNVADEDAVITGVIRIYRESTGLLIYTSRLAVTQLEHMTSTNIAALTPFDPPAPADQDYFIKADLTATSFLPGPPLFVSLGAWHFDIKTPPMGEAPAGHHATHEDGGSDELVVTGLSGALADDQPALAHDIAGARHTSGATPGRLLLADASGLPIDATNTDTQVANVVRQTTPQTLTDQATIDWNLALGGAATVTLAGDRTLNEASNMVAGARHSLRVIQDGTGTRLLTWHATYRFPGGVDPALSAAPGNIDILQFDCDGTNLDCVGMVSAVA